MKHKNGSKIGEVLIMVGYLKEQSDKTEHTVNDIKDELHSYHIALTETRDLANGTSKNYQTTAEATGGLWV